MCFLPCASRQGRPFWPPAGDHEGRPYGAFAPIRKDWEARMAYHILLVDDAPELRRMVGELLEGAGYAVTLAADCAQARRAWTESQPDAALLDVMLPDGDGFSLLEELRRVGNGVPVLFLSARDEDEARLRGLGLGADDYITKPFLPQELLLRLAAVLRRVYGAGAGEASPSAPSCPAASPWSWRGTPTTTWARASPEGGSSSIRPRTAPLTRQRTFWWATWPSMEPPPARPFSTA